MPGTTFICPRCDAELKVNRQRIPEGAKLRCADCDAVFKAMPSRIKEDPPPRRRKPSQRSGKRKVKAKQGLSGGVLAGIIGGAVLAVGAVVAIVITSRSGPSEDQQAKGGDTQPTPPIQKPLPKPPPQKKPTWTFNKDSSSPFKPTSTPAPTSDRERITNLKQATVYVQVRTPVSTSTGSGFVLHRQGNEGYIATNFHVIVPETIALLIKPKVSVVLDSGQSTERAMPAEIVAMDPGRDLAILKIQHSKIPAPIALANVHDDPYETLGVLICGFPFGDDLKEGRGRGNPEVTIGNGSVSSLRHDDSGKLRLVQIDGDLNPGNSGGPVVDKRGRLVGIAVATIERSSIGFAIPAKDLLRLLYGRALDPSLYPVRKDGNSLELIAMVPLADPFEQIRSVSLHRGTVAETESLMRKAKKTGEWPLLPKLKDVHFERKGRTAQARVQIQPQRSGDVLQVSYVNGEGKTIVTEPVVFELASVQPPPGGIQMPDITTPQAQGLTVEMMNQFPERYLAKSVTVKARMYGGVVGRGELRMLQVLTEGNRKVQKIDFHTSQDLATELSDLGLRHRMPVRLTGTLKKNPARGRPFVFEVSRVQILDERGKVTHSLPTAVTKLPANTPSVSQLNRFAEKYVGRQVRVEAMLYRSVVGRGNYYELQVSNLKNVKPGRVDFTTSRAIVNQLTKNRQTEDNARVLLTGVITKNNRRGGRPYLMTVTRIQYFNGGRVVQ